MIENGIANWNNIIQRSINFFSDEGVEKTFAGEAIKLGTNFGLGNTVRSIDLARLPQLGFDFDKIHNFQERK